MTLASHRRFFLVLGFTAALLSALCVSDMMRETDQASLITGAWHLFKGSSPFGENFYNYDKQYEAYWLLAGAFRAAAVFGREWSPVLIGNICATAIFWILTLIALVRLTGGRRPPSLLALLIFLATPTILLNSVYFSTAIVSAGFLLLCGVVFLNARGWRTILLAALLFFIAVGSRADAVLVAPLLVWLRLPTRGWVRRALSNPSTWALAISGVLALALGVQVAGGRSMNFDPVFHGIKVLLAYLVFGLGSSLILLALVVTLLVLLALSTKQWEKRSFYLAGAVSLIFPLLYYLLQLHSPRYLILSAMSAFVFCVSPRGRAFGRLYKGNRLFRSVAQAAAVVAVGLLVAGLRVPSLHDPRLSVSQPTLYPTADGHHPMGAYAGFMLAMRNAKRREIDHNQLAWKAAISASYSPSDDGYVHVYITPMYAYLELAVTLKGLTPRLENRDDGEILYTDSRSLMRAGSKAVSSVEEGMLRKPSTFVSPSFQGVGIVRLNGEGDLNWGKKTILLNRLFEGNEYREINVEDFGGEDFRKRFQLDGRPFAFVSQQPFQLSGSAALLDPSSGLYYLPGHSADKTADQLSIVHSDQITLLVQVLPAWMSFSNL